MSISESTLKSYFSCPRCGLMVREGPSREDTPLCPDCRRHGELVQMERHSVAESSVKRPDR